MRLSLKNLLGHSAKVWGSDGSGAVLPSNYEIKAGPQKGDTVITSGHYLSTYLKALGVADSTKTLSDGLVELDIDPLVPYTRSPKLTPENEDEIVLMLEELRSLKMLSNADFAKQAANAAALEKEQVADAGDTGEAKGKLFCLYSRYTYDELYF